MHRLVFAVLLAFSAGVFSQEKQSIEIPCSDAGSDAVTTIPDLVKDFASVRCTIYGHLISGADGILWTYPGAFAPVIIPAQMVRSAPKAVNHDMYFKHISAKKLPEREAAELYAKVSAGFDQSDTQGSIEVLELVASNNLGIEQKVYLFGLGSRGAMGFACQPTCKPDLAFLVLNMNQGG